MFKNFVVFFWLLLVVTFASQAQSLNYVNPFTGTSNSRWMLFPGATMPFGMVKLSPDNQENVWNGGYEYTVGSISGFSHLHAFGLSGLSIMPFVGKTELYPGQAKTFIGLADGPFGGMWTAGYRSRFDRKTEVASVGYYSVDLMDSRVKAELTSTTRTGWLRFTFPQSEESKILLNFNFPVEEKNEVLDIQVTQINATEIEGFFVQKNTYAGEHTVHFVTQFSKPIKTVKHWKTIPYKGAVNSYGTLWRDKQEVEPLNTTIKSKNLGGLICEFNTSEKEQVIVKTGISFVNVAGARLNLETETKAYDWNFDAVVSQSKKAWQDLLSSVDVVDKNEVNKEKFYTCLYRSYSGKSMMNDVDGSYVDMFEKVQKLNPKSDAVYSADSFWGTQWNLSPMWTLLSPKVANSWVNAMLEMYDRGGWIADAPTGFEYAPVMDAQHHIGLIISAYQKGIRDFDAEKAWIAIKHDLTTPDTIITAAGGHVGSRSLRSYMKYGYVADEDGPTSNTLEYAFDDYMAAQFAKSLGKKQDYEYFTKRSENYRNQFDKSILYMQKRKRDGSFLSNYDPFRFGCDGGWNGSGFMEGNAWLYSFYVPQNVPDLVQMMGKETFVNRLEEGFIHDRVDMGNQPNLQAPFLFNYAGKPWLTQKYSRWALDKFYDNSPYRGWQGEEDEGQLSSQFVLMSMGLFQMDGGTATEPTYDLSTPLFDKITIHLDKKYYGGKDFTIETINNSSTNIYIQSATLNGKPLNKPILKHSDLIKGGKLIYVLGNKPNEKWGN
jgi:predicted alpha-1,2-mannosidase